MNYKKITIGASLLVVSIFTPVIPQEMRFIFAYQFPYPRVAVTFIAPSGVIGSSSPAIPEPIIYPDSDFPDSDGNGLVSVAVFQDSNGNKVYIQIPDSLYSKMGLISGSDFNPQKNEFQSIWSLLTQEVNAAIAFDAFSEGNAVATSVTVSHTASGSNLLAMMGTYDETNNATSVTYDGNNATLMESQQGCGGAYVTMWYYKSPPTGAKNVVYTKGTSGNIRLGVSTFTGVDTATVPDSSGFASVGAGTSHTQSLTTTSTVTWIFRVTRNNGGNTSAGTNSTLRSAAHTWGIFDTNADQTPAGSKSMQNTYPQADCNIGEMASFSQAAVAAAGVNQIMIIGE